MKPIFTIHEGEFLVGDYINRKLRHKYDVWVATKDRGVDLVVTRKGGKGKAVGLQVKFSRSFDTPKKLASHVLAAGWYSLDSKKIRRSQAGLWIFVLMTLRHEKYFVVIPTLELRKRIPRGCGSKWNLYLSAYRGRFCYQVRGLSVEEQVHAAKDGVTDRRRNFSKWLENWSLLEKFTAES